jgi:hypothetical protein
MDPEDNFMVKYSSLKSSVKDFLKERLERETDEDILDYTAQQVSDVLDLTGIVTVRENTYLLNLEVPYEEMFFHKGFKEHELEIKSEIRKLKLEQI